MARLTPIDYRMDVLNPMQMAMSGYQAGFGQMQQLDDVRRQREADRMAAEVHDMQMGQLEQAQAQAMAMQQEQAAFLQGFEERTHTPETLRRFRLSTNEQIREMAGEELKNLDESARSAQFNRHAGMANAFVNDPEIGLTMLEEERDAYANAGDLEQVKVYNGLIQLAKARPEAGASIAYQLAMQTGTEEEMENLESMLAMGQVPEAEVPTAFKTLQLRAQAAGLEPGTPEYAKFMEQGGRIPEAPVSVTVATGDQAGLAYAKSAATQIAQEHAALSEAGTSAQRRIVQINQLQDVLDMIGDETGTVAGFKAFVLEKTGLEITGADKIQAASALISQLVPQQRPPGSGVMSDADLQLFKRSLPRIMGTPEGNKLIIDTMRQIADYDVQIGNIARRAMRGEISQAQADEMIMAVANPLAAFQASENLADDL